MLKKKMLIKICAILPLSLLLVTPTVTYADNSDQASTESSKSNQKNISYQSAYLRCVNQANGQVIQTMYADTVKVVNGVPERKTFDLGQIPRQIGNYKLAKTSSSSVEVDPDNPSGMTYIECDYYLPTHHDENDNHHNHPIETHQNIVNEAKKAYRAYHHTDKGFVAPGYYDSQNQYHPTMSLDEWREKNNIPSSITPGQNSKAQIAATKKKVANKKNKLKKAKKKAAVAKRNAAVQAQNRNMNIFKFIVIPLIALAIISIFLPWQKLKRKHSTK